MSKVLDYIAHPTCHPTPFRPGELAMRVFLMTVVLVVGVCIWPTWWWVMAAVVVGVALVTHPLCLITGKKHAPGGHWFHFEHEVH